MINGTGFDLGNSENQLVLGTWALVIVTSIGIFFSMWYTRRTVNQMNESNKILRLDLIGKLKPNLRIADFTKILNQPDPNNPSFSFELQNLGESSIDNMEVICAEHYPTKNGLFSIENFLKNPPPLYPTYNDSSTFLKGEKTQRLEYIPTGNDPRVDIIIWTKYVFQDGIESEIIQVIHFENWKYHSHNGYIKWKLDKIREKLGIK